MQTQANGLNRSNTNNEDRVRGFITDEDAGAAFVPRFTDSDFDIGHEPIVVTEIKPLPKDIEAEQELPVNPKVAEIAPLPPDMEVEQESEVKLEIVLMNLPRRKVAVSKKVLQRRAKLAKDKAEANMADQAIIRKATDEVLRAFAQVGAEARKVITERKAKAIEQYGAVCSHPECAWGGTPDRMFVPDLPAMDHKLGGRPAKRGDLKGFARCAQHIDRTICANWLNADDALALVDDRAEQKKVRKVPEYKLQPLAMPKGDPTETKKVAKSAPLTAAQIEANRLANIEKNKAAKEARNKKKHDQKHGTGQTSKADKKKAKAEAAAKKKR